jgi:hypothetical protein
METEQPPKDTETGRQMGLLPENLGGADLLFLVFPGQSRGVPGTLNTERKELCSSKDAIGDRRA